MGAAEHINSGYSLKVITFRGGYDKNLSYLVWCPATGIALLVDPATAPEPVQESVNTNNLSLTRILLTHTHEDHLTYLEEWLEANPRIEVVGHYNPVRSDLPNYRGLPDNGVVDLGYHCLVMLETPGHYPDCVCWYSREDSLLFTGDTVFVNRTGRTIGPLGNTRQLYRSIYRRLLILPSDTIVLPGHDYGLAASISIGDLKSGSDFFSCRNAAQFEEVMERFEAEKSR